MEIFGNKMEFGHEGGIPTLASAAKPSVFPFDLTIVDQALQMVCKTSFEVAFLLYPGLRKRKGYVNRIEVLYQK